MSFRIIFSFASLRLPVLGLGTCKITKLNIFVVISRKEKCSISHFTFMNADEIYDPASAAKVYRLTIMNLKFALRADVDGWLVLTAELFDRRHFALLVGFQELDVVIFAS